MDESTTDPSKLEENLSQSDDDGTMEGQHPLNVSVILRQVCSFLPIADLMRCTEVNSIWNFEVRTYLRDLREVTAINRGNRPCCSLRSLDFDLSRMNVNPYTGLCLNIPDHPTSLCTKTAANYNFILDQMPVKRLQINWEYSKERRKHRCPAVKFLNKVFSQHGASLEELIFQQLPGYNSTTRLMMGPFPKLKIIRFHPTDEAMDEDVLLSLMEATPKLQVLDWEFSIDALYSLQNQNFTMKKINAVKNFRFQPHSDYAKEMRAFAASSPKLEKLKAFGPGPDLEMGASWWYSLGLIFNSSAKTLKWLKLDTTVLAMFKSIGVPPLENLECLTIGMALGTSISYIDLEIEEICALNLTVRFPKLHSVRVYQLGGFVSRRSIPPFLNIGNDEENGNTTRISHLHAEDCSHSDSVPRLAKMLPHITNFVTSSCANMVYIDLWKFWPRLRTVEITQIVYDLEFNVDAFFCGISAMELTWLKEQDDEFLRNVHIVPTRPGLYSVKELTELKISIRLEVLSMDELEVNPGFFFSKVTGYLAFKRLRNIDVIVECRDFPPAIEHLKPFATVVTNDCADAEDGAEPATTEDDSD